MKTIYIASQYTKGDPLENAERQLLVADRLMDLGLAPFPPLYTHYQHTLKPRPYEDWTRADNVWVDLCDALIRLPGPSSGADDEVELAGKLGS